MLFANCSLLAQMHFLRLKRPYVGKTVIKVKRLKGLKKLNKGKSISVSLVKPICSSILRRICDLFPTIMYIPTSKKILQSFEQLLFLSDIDGMLGPT